MHIVRDTGREHASLEVRGTSCKEDVVGVPVDLEHSTLVLLDMFAHPPLIRVLIVADGHALGSASHSEFVLFNVNEFEMNRLLVVVVVVVGDEKEMWWQ